MFPFPCPTCEVKLIVKDEKLIGRILACPKCGSMVLVPDLSEAPTPAPQNSAQPTVQKRFPDVLTHETGSGVIGQVPKEDRRSGLFLEIVSPEADVSETEIKTRKILIGILIGLSVLLLVALGFLMMSHQPAPQPPEHPKPIPPVPVEQPPPIAPVEEIPKPLDAEPVEVPLPEIVPPQPTEPEIRHEERQVPNDSLSVFERKMPGLLETSVPNIDIAERLSLSILELDIDKKSLIEFVRTISHLTGIPMTLNVDEMKPLSLSVKTLANGHFQETTAEKVLTETLATLGLQWISVDRQILISPKDSADETDLTFDVSDLANQTDDLTAEVLAEMIRRLVCPEGTVTVLPEHKLSVVHDEVNGKSPKRLRDDILRFLEQLRVVRQLPQQTEWTGETLAPEAFGGDRVMEPMTLNYYRPAPLSRVVNQLESATELTILIDHQSLHRALCSFAAIPTTVQCNGGTVNDALEMSLASVESVALSYRIIDHQTLEITTAESVRQPKKMTVEMHRYQLQADETPEDVLRVLRSIVEPESWFVVDQPETKGGGDIVIDHPSGCLLVRQSQPAQRQIWLYLSTLDAP